MVGSKLKIYSKMSNLKTILSVLLVLTSLHSSAQLLPIQYDTLERSQEVILTGGLDFSTSGLQNELTMKFIRGGYITDDIKNASMDKHRDINRAGGILIGDVEYRNYDVQLLEKRDWGIIVKAGYNTFGGAVYSQDLYGLAMYGNDRYVGDTIDFSGFNSSFATYQKLGFGLIDRKSKSSITLNVFNISDYASIGLRDAQVQQDDNGDNINLVLDGEFAFRESQAFNQGIGFGVDVDFKIPFQFSNDQTSFLQIQAKNIGVGYLYEKQRVYSVDTTFNFSGFEFNQLFGDNAINFDSLDVLDTLGISSSLENRTFLLPGFIQVGKIVDQHSSKRVQSFFGLRLYPSLIYVPYVFGGAHFKANDWLSLGANISYGGFTNFRGGLYASMNFNKIAVGLATEDVIGAVSGIGKGKSIFLRVKCAF